MFSGAKRDNTEKRREAWPLFSMASWTILSRVSFVDKNINYSERR